MRLEIDAGVRERGRLDRLLERAARIDGEYPLSEYKQLRRNTATVVERAGYGPTGELLGYCQAAWHPGDADVPGHYGIELVVDPEWRTRPVGERLLEAVLKHVGDERVTLWAHTRSVVDIAEEGAWDQERKLLRMASSLPVACHDELTGELSIAVFRPGRDDAAWLEANNLAFRGHPENGCLTQDDLDLRMQQEWFDARGFFLAWDGAQIAGSCWTKVHGDGVGEIYIIGVVPEWAGRGLGRALICRGLRYLGEELDLPRAILYVEAENERAIDIYESLGFSTVKTIVAYSRTDQLH